MNTIHDLLTKTFRQATDQAYPSLSEENTPIEITPSTQKKFGHYQFNSAMRLAKPLGSSPRSIAEAIVAEVQKDEDAKKIIASLEVAGPGFVNITLTPEFLSKRVDAILRDPRLGIPLPEVKKRVAIDFSSPNIAKEMHVGHLRSSVIGDCLARLLEFLGHDVLRLNHIGDWGTAFGMLIAYLKEEAPDVLSGEKKTNLKHLVNWYRQAKKKFDEDEAFKKRSQLQVVALQSGEKEARLAWNIICEISRRSYEEIYGLLDVKLTERGESFYNPYLEQVVQDFEDKGLLTICDGAKCVFLEGFTNREGNPLPLIIQKSDGGYNYATTDLAALQHRVRDEKADRLIYVTDMGQAQHFAMVFKAAEKVGYLNPSKVHVDHVPFGLVLGSDGKKFRTRSGDTEPLIDLLQTAINESAKILSDRTTEITPDEIDLLAETIGIGAVKYADLSCNRTGDYTFNYDRMLRFEGNTAAFLLYAYVRIEGIKRKIDEPIEDLKKKTEITLSHPSEIDLSLHLSRFSDTLEEVAQELLPNRLTDYLFQLANAFNAFYRDCPVEGSKEQDSRLLLCEVTALTLQQGLHILGLHTVDRM